MRVSKEREEGEARVTTRYGTEEECQGEKRKRAVAAETEENQLAVQECRELRERTQRRQSQTSCRSSPPPSSSTSAHPACRRLHANKPTTQISFSEATRAVAENNSKAGGVSRAFYLGRRQPEMEGWETRKKREGRQGD